MDSEPAVGILGGSFNPPHLGHLVIASDACAQLDLERVLFVPAAAPPHKEVADGVPGDVRLELTRLAVAGDPRFAVSSIEVDRGLAYTVETLRCLRAEFPGRSLAFIMGSDSLLQFGSWYRPEAIVELARLVVAPRPGHDRAAIAAAAARWTPDKVVVIDSVGVDISSSMIRDRVRRGAPVRYLVPAAVEAAIERFSLYREP